MLLEVENLQATVAEKEVLRGLNLTIKAGEVHAIMGPNGAGKSSLASVLAGREDYEVTAGSASLNGEDLLDMDPEERAQAGLFLAFQYPVEIPGVSNKLFLQTAVNAVRTAKGLSELDMFEFSQLVQAKMKLLGMRQEFLERDVNVGFSGGEKKRNDMLQMALLEPSLCILDETDSGLDIDALKAVAQGVNAMRSPDRGFVLVTHYQRLLEYVAPDVIHILYQGRIVKSGGMELVAQIEELGYDALATA
ncbi:MAG: Fe-S cluster assembly ATPase SufC [Thiotrichales bacterium 32-46-8]|nr:Fe-S cluster assembly ATPase SufC [Gammaproteobacteria bacterium]OYX07769.1 MAG: Fe-S cluster assembly ATPase SufC [Thiotrichales bacterium 32-46-8]OYZ09207.1 MAG: Fe-S cluster assembly ATPase SufC [Thiotrichales bacterium 16-46-22]OZA20494.1 MAG: Fe-S cluster assembly ATPase SufC [Thiotrichales bacterium 17-46-47]OZA98257.1 MAG: Fe-S cluster assembly ATPase SufC [Thiotrichales bacterium 34-46-19]OZB87328.1 MAG: Fe-S cluster assembly ATPase SufC [Thiotrichales bacterium 12-47-6]HQT02277.1 